MSQTSDSWSQEPARAGVLLAGEQPGTSQDVTQEAVGGLLLLLRLLLSVFSHPLSVANVRAYPVYTHTSLSASADTSAPC